MDPLLGNAWIWNALIAIIEVVYIFVVIGVMDKLVERGFSSSLSRKVIHIAAGSYVIFWPLYDPSHWTRYLCVLMPLIWVGLFLSKGLSNDRDDPSVKTMTRTGDPRELLRGPLMFASMMVILGLALFNRLSAVLALGTMTWGDGLAPYVGGKYGKRTYTTFGPEKTVIGSLTVLVAGFTGSLLMIGITGVGDGMPWALVGGSAVVATVIEALSPRDVDNVLIPVGVLVFYYLVTGTL